MTSKKNKANNNADETKFAVKQGSPNSQSYVLPEHEHDDFASASGNNPPDDEFTTITNRVTASDDGRMVTEIFGRLGLKDAFALLYSLPITKKLDDGKFTEEEKAQMGSFAEQIRNNPPPKAITTEYEKPKDIKPLMRDLVSPIGESGDFPTQETFRMRGLLSNPSRTSRERSPHPPFLQQHEPHPGNTAVTSSSAFNSVHYVHPGEPPAFHPHISSSGFHYPSTATPQQAPTHFATQQKYHQPSQHNYSANFPTGSAMNQQAFAAIQSPNNQHTQGSATPTPGASGLPTGFAFRPVRSTSSYESDRVIVSRYHRGSTQNPKEHAKIREICTKAIQPQLDSSKIKTLLTDDQSNYDISEDASHWQDGIRSIWTHAVAYDYRHILMIPEFFDPNDQTSIPSNTRYFNAVLEHDKLTDEMCFSWQYFIRSYGCGNEVTSDQWFEDKLWKSLGPTLLSEVRSDFHELPDYYKGSISLLRIIIN